MGYPVRVLGAGPHGPGNPGMVQVTPVDRFFDRDPFFFRPLPLFSPYAYPAPPPPGTTCAWEKDVVGNSVYVCRPATTPPPPPVVSYGPVIYPVVG